MQERLGVREARLEERGEALTQRLEALARREAELAAERAALQVLPSGLPRPGSCNAQSSCSQLHDTGMLSSQ